MNHTDLAGLTKLVSDVMAYYRQPVSEFVLQVWCQACKPFTLEQVSKALTAHVTDPEHGVYPPKIADVVRILLGPKGMDWPGANEAWATALSALDERNTIIWTDETAKAWEIARPLAVGGDEIGARMAFRDAYERLVRTARDERRLPVVTISEGWDAEGRLPAVDKAVALGYLPASKNVSLPAPAFNAAALLAGRVEVAAHASPELRRRLIAMRDGFVESDKRRAVEREKRAATEAVELLERKAEVQKIVDDYDEAAILRNAEWVAVSEKTA